MNKIIGDIYKRIVPQKYRRFIKDFKELSENKKELTEVKREFLYYRILHFFEHNRTSEFEKEIEYITKLGGLATYPYEKTNREFPGVNGGFCKKHKLPYVIHKDKRLYFPKHFSVETAKLSYINFIVRENILGDGYMEKSPHQYVTGEFQVKNDDLVLDVGAGEGLFLLDVIDITKKGFVLESDPMWIKALNATFEPYKDKVTIINKFVTDRNSVNEITLDSCLEKHSGSIFIKMDIEGNEYSALCGSKKILERNEDIRLACCTYHKHGDANLLHSFFRSVNFQTEFSEGYMLFASYDKIQPPYFRRGLIRAQNRNFKS